MAATETGDGQHGLATNQVSSAQVTGAETAETDEEPMESAVTAEASANVGVQEIVFVSAPVLSESPLHGEQDKCVAAKDETESQETKHAEPEAAVVTCPLSASPHSPSPPPSSHCTGGSLSSALVPDGEPDKTSESEEESAEAEIKEELELKDKHVTATDKSCFDHNPAGLDVSEDTERDATSDHEELNTEVKVDLEFDTTEVTAKPHEEHEQESCGSNNLKLPAAHLDEMMDIGTVDQIEQEAQMKEEECNSLDAESSCSPAIINTVSVAEDCNSVEEEDDVKPAVLTPPKDEDQDINVSLDVTQSSSSPSSEATASTGRDSSSPAAMMNGMRVVKISLPRIDTGQLSLVNSQEKRSDNASSQRIPNQEKSQEGSQPAKSSPSPPLVKVKDEPIDEEYEQALTSTASTASVKDEPNTTKEDLKIGSVFSVTSAAQSMPILNPILGHIACNHCKKNLMKGQTAYQRKGCPALFCSTNCLTVSFPMVRGATKICHNCQKVILRPQDVILAPDGKGAMKEFCSQNCLTSFNYKRNNLNLRKYTAIKKPPQQQQQQQQQQQTAAQSLCSMCTRYCVSKHEVVLSGVNHKLCSDACFQRFRTVNNLSMAGCANCGSFCNEKPLMLKLEDSSKTMCNMECLTKFKEKTKMNLPCTMCRTSRSVAEMVHNINNDSVNLFCSSSCVMAFMVQTVSASGARLNCDNCGKNVVPAYHLAMSDTSIRNFCKLPCVMAFQEKFKKNQKQLDKLPVESAQIQATPTPTPQEVYKDPPKLTCSMCALNITVKPEVIQIKDKMVFVCSVDCSQEFKKAKYVASLCEYCKIEKITRDTKRIDNKDCNFCSDGCKLLFRHDLTKNWGKHCHSCVYCHCVSKNLVTAQYGGSTEDFCSEECRSKYTMLFCHVAKCDTCGRKGKLKQSLPTLGEVKHFCDLNCMLQFCSDKVATQGEVFPDVSATVEATPVIASVISLASPQTEKANVPDKPTQQNTVSNSQSKNSGNASIQTETVKMYSLPAPKILKNKALLCRPLVQNKGVSCRTQTADVEAQTDDAFPKVIILPVPVPVYVPVPMNMYSQCTPKPVGLPLPLPVPMFLPVTMDSAERIVETIQDIKAKIPSDPFEAELILMAEMVAEQDKNDKQERPKEKATEGQETVAPDDHVSNYSDDLDTDELTNLLNNWEDTSDAGFKSPARPHAHEKLNPIIDVPVGAPSEPFSGPPPAAPPPMDIEADFTVETLERMARERERSNKPQSPTPAAPRRRQAHRKAREKRGRKSKRSKAAEAASQKASANKVVALEIPKMKSEYGVDAWKRWIQWRQTQPNLEKPRFGSRPVELKEDLLLCTTAELSYGLCCFITEVKRPNGEPYSPDSLFYLCLGIQQYLFDNGRVENIFMDRFYSRFSTEFTSTLRPFRPSVTSSGYIHSRVEEEYLWDCKQLGAYSPIVLLNTLLFFCCKYFGFTTVEQHRQLSFAHVMRCTKTNANNTKTTFLRFYPPISLHEAETDPEVPAKKRKEEENKEEILEMIENTENPLRCPVRLYEFYLSKCSESIKQRTNLFYLHPERCCVPNSPLWFSSTSLDDGTMEAMLIRILTVRELHLRNKNEGEGQREQTKEGEAQREQTSDDPTFVPDEEEEEEDGSSD